MTTINLYQNQEEIQRKNSARAANGGFFFSLGILVLTFLALVGINLYASNLAKENQALADNIKQQNDSLVGVNSLQRIIDMQTRLALIKNNLQIKNDTVGQLKMTDILDHLGSDLSSGVVVSSYSYDSGKVKVSFNANNFNDAARQILNFKKSTYFAGALFGNVVRGEKSITSDMTMDIKSK